MRRLIAVLRTVLLVLFSLPLPRFGHSEEPRSSADDVVARMTAMDVQRRSEFQGYHAIVHYFALNKEKHAEMSVEVACNQAGARSFKLLDESGSHSIRKHVFSRMLREETEASRKEAHNNMALTPDNYRFRILGHEAVSGREAWVLEITPKVRSEYLIAGKIWIDQKDCALLKIEGAPGRDPSFWTRNVHIVRTYEKVGSFWLPASTHTVSNVVFFGPAEMTILVSDYSLSTAGEDEKDAGDPELAIR